MRATHLVTVTIEKSFSEVCTSLSFYVASVCSLFDGTNPDCQVTSLNGLSCPNGVCPCFRRRLLQASTTMGVSVAHDGADAPTPNLTAVPSFIGKITVDSPQGTTTPTPPPIPVTSTPPSEQQTDPVVIAVAVILPLLVVGAIIYAFVYMQRPIKPVTRADARLKLKKKKKLQVIKDRVVIHETLEPVKIKKEWYKKLTSIQTTIACQGPRPEELHPRLRLLQTRV